jgi:hypothetical protein
VRLKGERPRWDARRIHAFLERRLDAALLLNSRSASRKVLPFHGAQHHVLAPAHAHHPVLPSMIARRVARNCSFHFSGQRGATVCLDRLSRDRDAEFLAPAPRDRGRRIESTPRT